MMQRDLPTSAAVRAVVLALVALALAPAANAQVPEAPKAICVPVPGKVDKCPTWVRSHDAAADSPTPTVVTPDGARVLISGTSGDTFENASSITTIAYDTATGAPAWTSVYEGPEGFNDYATALTLSPDGGTAFLTGAQDVPKQFSPESAGEMVTVAVNTATGAVRWSREGLPGMGLAVTASQGMVVATGMHAGDVITAAYDAATGAPRWVRRYDGDAGGDDRPNAILVSGGRVFVTGREFVAGSAQLFAPENDRNMVTLAYDAATGEQLWRRIDDSGAPEWSWEEGNGLLASPDGATVYISGRSHFNGHSVLQAVDATTGERRWRRLLGPSSYGGIALTPAGDRILMTGFTSTAQFSGDRTRAFDAATGETLWQSQFLDNGDEGWGPYAFDLVVSPDGATVYVTGTERQEFPPLSLDAVTTAYRVADGATEWFAEYNSSRIKNDATLAHAISIAPDGETVFTSGGFYGPQVGATQRGWGLLAYRVDDALLPSASSGCSVEARDKRIPILCVGRPPSVDLGRTPTVNAAGAAVPCTAVPVVRDRCETWVGTHDTKWNHGAPAYGYDLPMASAVSPADGSVFVTGMTLDMESETFSMATAAFDPATGARRWNRLHVPEFRPYSQPFGIAVSPDGKRVYVTGVSHWDNWVPAKGSFLTIAYDAATGEELWTSAYHGSTKGLNIGFGVTVSPDGEHVYATGLRDGVNTNYDLLANSSGQLATISYDADTGEREWIRGYGSEGAIGPSLGHAVAVTDDGSAVLVTGPSKGTGDQDAATIAYRASGPDAGERLWASRHAGANDDVPVAIVASGDGAYVTGWHVDNPSSGATSFSTTAIATATGAERWSRSYGTTSEPAYATGLAVGSDGSVYVTGSAVNGVLWGGATVAYTPSGTQRWAVREPLAAPSDLLYLSPPVAVAPDGSKVYVAGQQEVDAFGSYLRSDVTTTAYAASDGSRAWTGRYNGAETQTNIHSGVGIGVSPNGSAVFTSAWFSYAPSEDGNFEDYGVLAYPA